MYDVIYFNAWSDIICTAAKLLHGTSASLSPCGQRRENVSLGLKKSLDVLFIALFVCFSCRRTSCPSETN